MKVRKGFVSNSSSSSFIVNVNLLTAEQVEALVNYQTRSESPDDWVIYQVGDEIRGSSIMDNDDLTQFLKKYGIDPDLFTWDY